MNNEKPKTIPEGYYTARAKRWSWDRKTDGSICLPVVLEITGPEHKGYQLDGKLYFDTDRADNRGRTQADRSIEALRAMGMEGDIDSIGTNTGGIDRGECDIKVEINDKGYAFAKYINAPRKTRELRTFDPPPKSDLGAFFETMKGRGKPAPSSAQSDDILPPDDFGGGGGANDDDIPF